MNPFAHAFNQAQEHLLRFKGGVERLADIVKSVNFQQPPIQFLLGLLQ